LKILPPVILSALAVFFFVESSKNRISPEICEKSGFPVMFVDTLAGKKISSKTEYVSARYELDGKSGECKIRGRGNTTWQTRELYKKPYLLKLSAAESFLGMAESEKWILMANTADKSFLRNWYGIISLGKIFKNQKWIPDGKPVFLFLNGKFNGAYFLFEKIEMAKNRLELPEGSFLAVVNSRMNKEFNFVTDHGTKISICSEGNQDDFLKMQKIIQRGEDAIFSGNSDDAQKGWRHFLDENSFADWYIVNEFTKNHDARFQSSCFFYYDSSAEKIFMGPPWDFDIAAGNISWDDCENPAGIFVGQTQWYAKLLQDEEFFRAVKNRYRENRGKLQDSIDEIKIQGEKLKFMAELNDSVWPNLGKRQWPHAPGWKNRRTYMSEVQYLTDFLQKRMEFFDDFFAE
jgi:spore coat protein CotH